MAGTRALCQLYLVLEAGAAAGAQLAAVLARGSVASVLLRAPDGAKLTAQSAKPLVDLAQAKDVAILIRDDVALARTLRADGVHLSASADAMSRYEEARGTLGARAIVGVDAGGSRHVAMEAAEAGADYVAFGQDRSLVDSAPADEADAGDGLETFDQRGLVDWWTRVIEVPCVAFDVVTADAAKDMAAAGADFIAVVAPRATSPSDVAAWFADMQSAVERADA